MATSAQSAARSAPRPAGRQTSPRLRDRAAGWQRRWAALLARLRAWPPTVLLARWYARRPFLTTWVALALGFVVMVILFGHDAGLTLRQHATLAAISVGLAALCTWIIFLEHADPAGDAGSD